jgi:ABC-2 type transport system permease protein/lipopolysaccharide transport system permease protein
MSSTDTVRSSSTLRIQLRQGLNSSEIRKAWKDILGGWERRALWGTLGLHDIRQKYRRSVLGPFWITVSMGVLVMSLGMLYGKIFKQNISEYLPFVSSGFVSWGLISGFILDGTRSFIAAEGMIRQITAPVSIYVYRSIWANLITFAHDIWIFIAVAVWFGLNPGWVVLLVIPGLVLVLINGLWVGLLFGLFGVRFRDVPMIVQSVVQVVFFITPIIWRPSMLPERAIILELNPFYHFVEIIRAPLLGHLPSETNLFAVLLVTLVGWAVTLFFYSAYRWRIAYWA